MNGLTAISSWSGGKDSCLACYKAVRTGHHVACLLTFVSKEYQRCCFHGIERNLLSLQAESTGIPLVQKAVGRDMATYEKDFKEAVSEIVTVHSQEMSLFGMQGVAAALRSGGPPGPRTVSCRSETGNTQRTACTTIRTTRERLPEIKATGIQAMVFGDVYLDEHRQWVDRVCRDLDITPVQPLWNTPPGKVVREFIDAGFKAVVVSCKADMFGKDFVGRYVDEELVRELEKRNICPCGENGEFHTFVVDGPLFHKRIEIQESEPVLRQGFWEHWFLDIRKYRAVRKRANS